MDSADPFAPRQIGDRPRDAQNSMKAARRQTHRGGSIGEQFAPRIVRGRNGVEQFAIGLGIGAHLVVAIARRLDRAGGGKVRSAALTLATSTCRSMRSSNGPDTLAW